MTKFPPGSIRAAVAAVGDAWPLLHEPNHAGEHNESLVAEIRDAEVMRLCESMSFGNRRFSMLRRASLGLTAREARELIA